ncbi:protein N-terminal asparagine amidohydrolase-like [Corticium candelabrum]|uniref:protein N-terminal asparagine amidohydrolase-like n=1 Tax=Corticium candelabrum TaxID=121492 RepID=UPI002E253A90|nr:protein N-terminal asparagine amidohydrolase-like [Corticium candelabrum]
MPLFLKQEDKLPFTGDYRQLIQNEDIKTAAAAFTSHQLQQPAVNVLYVAQREMATVNPMSDAVQILGSDDATTCHIAVVRHIATRVTTLSHLDGSRVADCVAKMVESCGDEAERILGGTDRKFDVFLVGGFDDERHTSVGLSNETLRALQSQPHHLILNLACITGLNDRMDGRYHKPIVYGIGVDIQTGDIFPASFTDKGPDEALRSARIFSNNEETMSIYNPSTCEITIPPFDYTDFPGGDTWLHLPDSVILQNLSTSPHAEPPHFVSSVKATIRYMGKHPRPRETIFLNRPRRYRRSPHTNEWTLQEG